MRRRNRLFCYLLNIGLGVIILLSYEISNHNKQQSLHPQPPFLSKFYNIFKPISISSLSKKGADLKIVPQTKLTSHQNGQEIKLHSLKTTKKSKNHREKILAATSKSNAIQLVSELKVNLVAEKNAILNDAKSISKTHDEEKQRSEENISKDQKDKENKKPETKEPLDSESKKNLVAEKNAKLNDAKSISKTQDEEKQRTEENVSKNQKDKEKKKPKTKAEQVKKPNQKKSNNTQLKPIVTDHLNKTEKSGKNGPLKNGPFLQKNGSNLSLTENKKNSHRKNKKFLVPNIVHYVWLNANRDLKFHEVLGILSAQKYLKPDIIKVHCDKEPTGIWWTLYKNKLTSLEIVHMSSTVIIYGISPAFPETKSDIARIQILQKEGGIYLDFDVIVIQPFDDLRNYELTLGVEYHGNPGRLNNGIIIAAPNARFLKIWLESYKDFKAYEWDDHSCIMPYLLAPKYPDLIHVDENRINYPGGNTYQKIYYENYDWTKNYAIHLWFRVYSTYNPKINEFDPENIKTLDSTFGQIARRTLYDKVEKIP